MEKLFLVSIQYAAGTEGETFETTNLAVFSTPGAAHVYALSAEVEEKIKAHYFAEVSIDEIPYYPHPLAFGYEKN
jgi:hypothetical protein